MRELERRVVLSVLDRKWREHLYEMDYLQEGIGLRAMAQRDPLVEYQREGYLLFQAMMEAIKEESVGYLFNLEVEVEQPAAGGAGQAEGTGAGRQGAGHAAAAGAAAVLRADASTSDGGVETHSEGEAAAPAPATAPGGNRAARRAKRRRG